MFSIRSALAAACLLGVAHGAGAQPRNNLCADAPYIKLGAVEGTTLGADASGSATCGLSSASPDVYYRFVAPAACQFEVLTCDGNTDFDTVVSIHTACPAAAFNQITCNNDGCGSERSRAVFNATPGAEYIIRVAGADGAAGRFTLIVRQLGRPANDVCAQAAQLVGISGSVTADTTCAMSEGRQVCGIDDSTGSPNVYFKWTAPMNGRVAFDTCSGATFRTVLTASTGCPQTNINRICGVSACDQQQRVEFGAVAGATYYIRVAGFDNESGTFTLSWTLTPGDLPNDFCGTSQTITLGTFRGSNIGAGTAAPLNCAPSTRDVYYRFRSPADSIITIDTCSPETTFDTVLSAHTSCPTLDSNLIVCSDNACGLGSSITFAAQEGIDYYVRVAGANNGQGAFVLNVRAEVEAIVFDPSTLGEYYLLGDRQTMSQFRHIARGLGGTMATLHSFSEAQFVTNNVMQHGNVRRSAAIGLSDELMEGNWRWDDSRYVGFTFFAEGQPDDFNGAEDHVHILDPVSGIWNDYPDGAYPGLHGIAECSGDIVAWNYNPSTDRFYVLFEPSSWKGAQARARAMGGNLVTINDAAENDYVRTVFGTYLSGRNIWIGLNDASVEGSLRWADGTVVGFTNFAPGEPNNLGNEDFVEMIVDSGLWNDRSNLQAGRPILGVAEFSLPNVAPGPRCGRYRLLEPASFYPALFRAVQLGGTLVGINSAEENEFIRARFAHDRLIWLGGSDKYDEGAFFWYSEEPFTYTNFAPGEPNNGYGIVEEDYLMMSFDGTWFDFTTLQEHTLHSVVEFYCPCDWNHDFLPNSQDFFDFLTDFFNADADFNCDTVVNSQDFFDFITCFFAGCE